MKKSAKKRKMKLYEENAYLNEFETKITNIDHENNYIELEKTAFYGQSGGQPGDTGILEINSKKIEAKNTLKNKNTILHQLEETKNINIGNLIKGKLGKDLNTKDGYNAAKRCALSLIAQAKKICNGDLTKINSCIKITGFVNSTDEFIEQPKVINGASDLIVSVIGDTGMHTRAAISSNSLPLGVAVEVDAIFELK